MDAKLYRLVYCSRNRIGGNQAAVAEGIQHILTSARANNSRLGLTGALLYNEGNFAQVLEGPLPSIDQIFEKIQRDERHGEATVIHSGPAAARIFPEWSMAFSNDASNTPAATIAFDAAFGKSEGAGEKVLSLLEQLVVREDL